MTGRRLRLTTIVALLALDGIVLLAWTQPWASVTIADTATLAVAGDVAAPALTALALSGLALAGALTIAGPLFRVVLGVLQVALGALVTTSAALMLGDPVSAVSPAVTAATGVSGRASVAALVETLTLSPWPVVALVAGILLAVVGASVVVFTRRWPASSRRYQAVNLEEPDGESSAIGDWDALSDGRDPTRARDDG